MSYPELKAECYEANLLLPKYGLIDLTFGNVSVADHDRGVFAIKPSGVDYNQLAVTDITIVDFVVHTHSRNAVAFAQAGLAIPCVGTTHADYFQGEVPVTRPMTEQEIKSDYEWETGNVIVERFQHLDPEDVCAVLVHGHGPFSWGSSSAKAIENALALEIIAEMAYKTLQLNPAAAPISGSLLQKHFSRKHGKDAYYGQGGEMTGEK
jgi:L-ribulose-5-phosphate 4-epimerase